MAVFQMLTKVVRSPEFLALVALAKFVDVGQMLRPELPNRCRLIRKLLTAISTRVELCEGIDFRRRLRWAVIRRWDAGGRVKGIVILTIES